MNPSSWFHLTPPPLASITSSICQATSKLGTFAGTLLPPIDNDENPDPIHHTSSPGKDLTTMFNQLGSTVVKSAQQLIENWNKECQTTPTSDLPWIRDGIEHEQMKESILALSQLADDSLASSRANINEWLELVRNVLRLQNEENFLSSPPTGANYVFDMSTISSIASAILEVDPALQQMRFHLVPKQIKEEAFWRNYFYRLYQIEQSLTTIEKNKEKRIEKENIDDDTSVIDMDEVRKEKDFDETEWDQGVIEEMENLSSEDFQNVLH